MKLNQKKQVKRYVHPKFDVTDPVGYLENLIKFLASIQEDLLAHPGYTAQFDDSWNEYGRGWNPRRVLKFPFNVEGVKVVELSASLTITRDETIEELEARLEAERVQKEKDEKAKAEMQARWEREEKERKNQQARQLREEATRRKNQIQTQVTSLLRENATAVESAVKAFTASKAINDVITAAQATPTPKKKAKKV